MDKSEVIKILRNEQTCVRAADNCGRDCANCHLVMDDKAILEAYDTAIEMLSEPERKTGAWEEIVVISDAYDISGTKTWASRMRCNRCGFITTAIEGHIAQYGYCPQCGCRMM